MDEQRTNPTHILVGSIYGQRTKLPLVTLKFDGVEVAQLELAAARKIALDLLACADAAENDAFMVEWLRRTAKLTDAQLNVVLLEYRQERDDRAGRR